MTKLTCMQSILPVDVACWYKILRQCQVSNLNTIHSMIYCIVYMDVSTASVLTVWLPQLCAVNSAFIIVSSIILDLRKCVSTSYFQCIPG